MQLVRLPGATGIFEVAGIDEELTGHTMGAAP
jgi:hypothetical protein